MHLHTSLIWFVVARVDATNPDSSLVQSNPDQYGLKKLLNEEEFLCDASLSKRSSTIAAKWARVLSIDPRGEAPMRVVQVLSYIEHSITVTQDDCAVANAGFVEGGFCYNIGPKVQIL